MPDESTTPPADPPSQQALDGQGTQAPPSEPVSPLPSELTPSPQETTLVPEPETVAPVKNEGVTGQETEASEPEQFSGNLMGTAAPEPTPESPPTPQPQVTTTIIRPHGDLSVARAKIQETKRKKLDKIMAKLSENGQITNDEVEKLLHISDATATRYLQSLEKENRIKQTGATGKAVFYEKS